MSLITIDRNELDEITEDSGSFTIRTNCQELNLIGRRVDVVVDVDDADAGRDVGPEEKVTVVVDEDIPKPGEVDGVKRTITIRREGDTSRSVWHLSRGKFKWSKES